MNRDYNLIRKFSWKSQNQDTLSQVLQVQSRFSATHIWAMLLISVTKYVTAILVQLVSHLGRHTTMDKCTKKSTRVSLEEKFKALEMIRKGSPDIEIMPTYNFSGRFVWKLKREGHKLPNMGVTLDKAKRRKSTSMGRYPHIENQMLDFVRYCRDLRLPVTKDIIRFQAQILREKNAKEPSITAWY